MRKSLKYVFRVVVGFVITVAVVASVIVGPYYLRVQRFEADPLKGFSADYFVYASPGAKDAANAGETVTMLVQPNNSGANSDDPDVHRKDAWWTGFERHKIADELDVVLLVPAFIRPSVDWEIYTHALDRDVLTTTRPDLSRLDLQLLAIVDNARGILADAGVPIDEKILIQGFSASGMFANRFVVLHPERVKAVAAGSPGGWPIAPVAEWRGETLPYPAGVADLRELVGHTFDSDTYITVPQLIIMGSLDNNDSVDFRDGWEQEPAATLDRLFGEDPVERWKHSQEIYRSAGADARFVLVDGIGHDRKKLQSYTTQFFADILFR